MAKKKIISIEGLGKNTDTLLVQKSHPLTTLWQSDLTLAEFKILDTYLSRIDSHKPEQREVVLEKGKLEELLGVTQIKSIDLDTRLTHLQKTVVHLKRDGKKVDNITLFERSQAEQDEHGKWKIILTCTPSAMKYIFNVEELGYLRYRVHSITTLKSLYSYLLFMHLELNRFRKSWEIDLGDLKKCLNCADDEAYKEYKIFNNRILKRSQKELHEKTECSYTYEPVKKGRSVVAIRFTVETLSQESLEYTQETQDKLEKWKEENKEKPLWQYVLEEYNFEFTKEQIEAIREMLVLVPDNKLPAKFTDDIDVQRYHYIGVKISRMSAMPNIKRPYNYLLKLIEQDLKEDVKKQRTSSFDIDEIERLARERMYGKKDKTDE